MAKNNTNARVKDIGVIEEANNLPPEEVRNYLNKLQSLVLIELDIKVAGADFRHPRITREGINRLQNQDSR